jgi:peptidoglycan hydrolase-like protein with peptidoglycan-binding domain/anti-sigma regulatory factor (Ser/Thr protein kinase)
MERIFSVFAAVRPARAKAGILALSVAALIGSVFPAVSTASEARDGSQNQPILVRGSGYGQPASADDVRALQRRLRQLGFAPGPIDGLFGPLTEGAVQRFQGAAGLAPDGVVGPATRKALRRSTPSAPTLALGAGMASRNGSRAVGHLQRELRAMGFAPGPSDGRFGVRTEAAVRRFQASVRLAVDGVVGPLTNGELARLTPGGRGAESDRRNASDGRRTDKQPVRFSEVAPLPEDIRRSAPASSARRATPDGTFDFLSNPLAVAPAAAVLGLGMVLAAILLVPRLLVAVGRIRPATQARGKRGELAVGYASVVEPLEVDTTRLPARLDAINETSGALGLDLVEVVHDTCQSGAKPLERPGLRYALERIAERDARYLVVGELTDLGRSRAEVSQVLRELARRGGVIAVRDGLATGLRVRGTAMSDGPDFAPRRFILEQPASPDVAGTARQMIDSMTTDLSGSKRHDLMLLTTEVVNNAVRHAARDVESDIRVEVLVSRTQVRLEVRDRGPGFDVPQLPEPGEEQSGGWGLYLIDAIADRWGVEHEPTTVWLEVARN